MKRALSVVLCFVFVLLSVPFSALPAAADTYGDFEYSVSGGEATITGYTGDGGDVVIPSQIGGYSVTSIGYWAFEDCTILTNVIIPNSVTSIEDWAFYGCLSLTSITIPGSVTSIGDYAFYNCTSLTNVIIGNGVTTIGGWAFEDCASLASITVDKSNPVYHSSGNCLIETASKTLVVGCKNSVIPSDGSVTSIGNGAFTGRKGLTSITIPSSVTRISNYAFPYCDSLTNITVDKNNPVYHSSGSCIIETASKTLIAGCKNSTIPSDGSVTSIGDNAFRGCTNLTSINIPASVTSIGDRAFDDCASLTSVTIPGSVKSIGDDAFYNCASLKSITIPDSVTSIGESAFDECYSLTSITIGNGVTSIGDNAFRGCTSLIGITIPGSVTSIGKSAFDGCASLTSITIPASVTFIGEMAFYGCSLSLTSITVDKSNPVYHSSGNCLIKTASKTLIAGCKNSVIPSDGSVTSIEWGAFYNCTSLASIIIPGSVTSISSTAFVGCESIEKIVVDRSNTVYHSSGNCLIETESKMLVVGCENSVIPSDGSVYYIDCNAFANRTGLKTIVIPNGVRTIQGGAFRGCTSLTSVSIPASVTGIGAYYFSSPFGGCDSLTSITVDADNPVYHSSGNCIIDTEGTLVFGCKNSVIPSDGSVTGIGYCAFSDCTGLRSITIPDSVTYIYENAFSYCTNLTSIYIPGSVTSIGEFAFCDCPSLTTVYYTGTEEQWAAIEKEGGNGCLTNATIVYNYKPGSIGGELEYSLNGSEDGYTVTGIGSCTGSDIIIPETHNGLPVMSIGESAFENCTSITGLTISAELYRISENAFKGCANLNNVSITGYVSEIEDFAFSECTALTEIYLPRSVQFMGFRVFDQCTKLANIYCGADRQPEDWDEWWSYGCNATVHWGAENANAFTYLSTLTDKNEEYEYYYSDSFFDHSAYEYDHKLARMSLCAAMASMGHYKSDEITGAENIKELYGKIGIDNKTTEDHYKKPNNNADSIGFVIGSKTITCTDGDYSLIAVTIRSGGYENEWISNFTMGESGDHEGFSKSANVVVGAIKEYIKNNSSTLLPNKKVWIQGYSRGGAVTNLTAAYLDNAVFKNEIPGLELKDIYAYGFAVPQGRSINTPGSDSTKYNNIFSIVNPSDLVTKVAPSTYGFGRYGVTLETPTALNSKNTGDKRQFEDVYVPAMMSEYDNILSRLSEVVPDTFDYGTSYNQQILFDYLIECIAGAIGTRKDYYSIQYTMSHIAGFAMMKQFDKLEPITVSIAYWNDPSMHDVIFTTADSDGDGKPDEPDISLKDFLMSYSFKSISTVSFTSVDIILGNYYMSLSKKQFDKLLNGLFDYYYRETGERINMEIICLGVTGQADPDHVMGLFTNLNSITNLQDAHYPELCLSWMNVTNDLVASGKTRYLYIHCPVDVNVYDGNGQLVASVENDSVKKQGEGPVQAYVDAAGTKIFLLPDSEEYRVEVTATDNGEVDYSVAEYDHSVGMFTRYVDYKGITVNKGDNLNGKIDDLDKVAAPEYELRNTDNKPIAAANDVQGAEANALALEDHSSLDRDISEFLDFFVPGDVNGNGKIDSKDYAMTKRAFLKTYTLTDEQLLRADINGNGKVDSSEYAMIKRHFLKTYVIPGAEGA